MVDYQKDEEIKQLHAWQIQLTICGSSTESIASNISMVKLFFITNDLYILVVCYVLLTLCPGHGAEIKN